MTCRLLWVLWMLFPWSLMAQEETPARLYTIDTTKMKDYDPSLPSAYIQLDEVQIIPPLSFKSGNAVNSYQVLRWMVKRVYPFAKLASDRFKKINERLAKIESNSDRRRYLKRVQKYIEDEFGEQLKKYTIWEGQILIKLIYRQTGITCYELVAELRSSFKAFFYNVTAKLFKMSLKKEYHPDVVYKDYLIEDILQRYFQDDVLEEQASALDIDYFELVDLWRARGIKVIQSVEIRDNKDKSDNNTTTP